MKDQPTISDSTLPWASKTFRLALQPQQLVEGRWSASFPDELDFHTATLLQDGVGIALPGLDLIRADLDARGNSRTFFKPELSQISLRVHFAAFSCSNG
jgi:hypothetical protein